MHNVTHIYHPKSTKIIPQTNYSSQYKDHTAPFHHFSLHQMYMTNHDMPTKLLRYKMYNLLQIHPNIEFCHHYHILQKISNLSTSLLFGSQALHTLSILHFAIHYLITKHAIQNCASAQYPLTTSIETQCTTYYPMTFQCTNSLKR